MAGFRPVGKGRTWVAAAAVASLALVAITTGTAEGQAGGPQASRSGGSALVRDPASLVNSFLGTANGGDTFPGADMPFGMVQWSPDTPSHPSGGGYNYSDNSITGYSLAHLSGPGCPTEGDVPILPTVGPVGTSPATASEPLNHADEVATPGYYQLTSGGVETQLTATTRSGMARFTFPSNTAGNLLFKLSGSEARDTGTHFQVISNREVAGWITSGYFCGTFNEYTMHFDMVFNYPFTASGTWLDSTVTPGSRSITEDSQVTNDGAYVSFPGVHHVVKAKVGLSYVSAANAVLNRRQEDPGWSLNGIKAAAHNAWNTALSKVQVGGGTTAQEQTFYTALYHSLLHPNVFSDVNGQYMGMNDQVPDGQVHTVAAHHAQYANFSGWDVYRSEIPLLAVLDPYQTSDMVTSLLNDYAQSGQLPRWPENDGQTYSMTGDPADPIIASSYAFGARNFNAQLALADMQHQANVATGVNPGLQIRPGLNYYAAKGYLPIDGTYSCCMSGPVSTQEEDNAADNAIAELAKALGESSVASTFATRANNWQNVYNPDSGFLQPKQLNGVFQAGFDPTSGNGFVEGDSYIYTPSCLST